MTFNVTLDKASTSPITVNYATADGTATTADNDYTAKTGAVTFAAGSDDSQQITVPIIGDNKFEPNETFSVNLSGASSNSQILDAERHRHDHQRRYAADHHHQQCAGQRRQQRHDRR